jgi:CBS domain containing-hemolysin-like protein
MISLAFLIILLALSAFFSASESAFFSANRMKIKHLAENGDKNAIKMLDFYNSPDKILTTILVGNNIANAAVVSIATYMISKILTGQATIVSITTITMSILILIFGEISPKTLAVSKADKISLLFITPIYYLYKIFSPPVRLLSFIGKSIIRIFGVKEIISKHDITEDEARTFLSSYVEKWHITKTRKKILESAFYLKEILVKEIMIPRTDIIAIDVNYPLSKIISIIQKYGYSRYPVYQDNLDNIKGILYVKDIISIALTKSHFKIEDFLREPYYLPDNANIENAMRQMQKNKVHVAMVVDEYGGLEGLLTLEDILEEIVGEIQDEYDTEEAPIAKLQRENLWQIQGDANIRELNEILPEKLPEEDHYNTIAGFILKIADKIPQESEIYKYKNYTFQIQKMEGNKISSVLVKLKKSLADTDKG